MKLETDDQYLASKSLDFLELDQPDLIWELSPIAESHCHRKHSSSLNDFRRERRL